MPFGIGFGIFASKIFAGNSLYAGFGYQPARDEAIEYFKKKQSKNPDAPLVRIDENRQPAYDKLAILGYRHINEKEIFRLNGLYEENRRKREDLLSGSNFFVEMAGADDDVHEAERALDDQAEQIQGVISKLRKNISDLEHLPELPSFMYNPNAPRLRNAKMSRHDVLARRKSKSTQVM